jgi:hypothetical protein
MANIGVVGEVDLRGHGTRSSAFHALYLELVTHLLRQTKVRYLNFIVFNKNIFQFYVPVDYASKV